MKKLLLLLLLLVIPSKGAITLVQKSGTSFTSGNTASLTGVAVNDLLVGAIAIFTNAVSTTYACSGGGLTWVVAVSYSTTSSNRGAAICYAIATSGGSITLTMTPTPGASPGVVLVEYSGIATVSPLDQTNSALNSAAEYWLSGTITTTVANELIVTDCDNNNGSAWSPGPGWTIEATDTVDSPTAYTDIIVTSTGTYPATSCNGSAIACPVCIGASVTCANTGLANSSSGPCVIASFKGSGSTLPSGQFPRIQ